MKFGCHVSIKEGYFGAAKHAYEMNAQAFQYFPKNPRSLVIKNFDLADAEHCRTFSQEKGLVSVSHTPYPTSLTPSKEKKDHVIHSLLNDLEITDASGSIGAVVHFGKLMNENDPLSSYQLMIEMLNLVLSEFKGNCKILLENNAGTPGSLGTTMEELVQVRNLCDFPEKVGFCLDTCHAFASGLWNGNDWETLCEKGTDLGYFKHLEVIHLNNSKYPTGEGKDRHANIFQHGYITEDQFNELITSPVLKNIPFILETPTEYGTSHAEEIRELYNKWGDSRN